MKKQCVRFFPLFLSLVFLLSGAACSYASAETGLDSVLVVTREDIGDVWNRNSSGRWTVVGPDGDIYRNTWYVSASDGKTYLLDTDGQMVTGWTQIADKWYYFSADGAMATGWVRVTGHWYFMDESGVMQTGWIESFGNRYYLDESGVLQTGWVLVSDLWYYTGVDGAMRTETLVPFYDNETGRVAGHCYVDSNGVMVTDTWILFTHNTGVSYHYHFDNDGKLDRIERQQVSD